MIDLTGRARDPLGVESASLNVFIFVRTDCPISNRYAPEISRLQRKYSRKGISFWLVYPDPDESVAAIREHQRQFQLALPALRDGEQRLVKWAHASVTPEAAVFTKDGTELYHGRIDDRNVEIGETRAEPRVRDLEVVIAKYLGGDVTITPATRAVGCFIEAK